ncbi:hypothetical protein GP486_007775, partial [Trichoglossum hirsutum]
MPYTSPSRSPLNASYPTTQNLGRNGSHTGVSGTSTKQNPPRSTTYMHRHRRTPSLSKAITLSAPHPAVKLDCRLPGLESEAIEDYQDQSAVRTGPSLRRSPPPVSDSAIPSGAIISSPDSTQNSSDDEACKSKERRGRRLENLAELQEAIRIIEQRRGSSPDGSPDSERRDADEEKVKMVLQLTESPILESTTTLYQPPSAASHFGQTLVREARKMPHSRSSTETSALPDKAAESPDSSDIDDDAYRLNEKPVMVRKKSGELVKPALRPRRPSSMPGTPTYSKAVHFDSHLEHVRHFLQVDKPLAVSAGSSPVEAYESDPEFPFVNDDFHLRSLLPFEWEIALPNFPKETVERRSATVRVERVFLSSDNKTLIGTVACSNLAYGKHVAARFTLDFWKTTSEVTAEYNDYISRVHLDDGYDRFNFSIKLEDQTNLEKKVLFFCVRYNVNGREYWDNNGSFNYQVDFRKKVKPQNGKNGMHGVGARALPRNIHPSAALSTRPVSLPASFDDFIDSPDSKHGFGFKKQQQQQLPPRVTGGLSSSAQHLKNSNAANGTARDSRTPRSGQAFGNRYDFGASLTAAIQAASSRRADGESETRVRDEVEPSSPRTVPSEKSVRKECHSKSTQDAPAFAEKNDLSWLSHINVPPSTQPSSSTTGDASTSTSYTTEKPTIKSNQYNEILDKYCF